MLTGLNLKLIEGLLICPSCQLILLPANVRSHMRKIHKVTLKNRDYQALKKVSYESCYKFPVTVVAKNGWTTSLPVKPLQVIEEINVHRGFYCSVCNVGELTADSLRKQHLSLKAKNCQNGTFIQGNIQFLRVGSKKVGFGVVGAVNKAGNLCLTLNEYEAAQRDLLKVEAMEGGNVFEVGETISLLYRKLDWFRLNSEKTDYVDLPRPVLLRLDEFVFEPRYAEKLFKFFKSRMQAVHGTSIHHRMLLADSSNRTIKPIRDAKDSYSTFFVELLSFVFAVADGYFSLADDLRPMLQPVVGRLKVTLEEVSDLVFADVEEIWRMLVEQKMHMGWEVDIIHMFIRIHCIDRSTGQLALAAVVEKMSARAFYFCRLFHLNRLVNPTTENRDENVRLVEEYFKSKDTPFNRLCFLKGLASRIMESENVSPIITRVTSSSHFWVGDVEMSPQFLRRMFRGLSDSFSKLLNRLLFHIPFDFDSFEVVDNPVDRAIGAKMRCKDAEMKELLFNHLNKHGDPVNRQLKLEDGNYNVAAVKEYLKLHDDSCRILCPLIHLCSGMPARATEINLLTVSTGITERNFYFADGQVMIVSRYNKTNVMTGSHKIISRFLPSSLSKKVAAWIIVVRPFYNLLASVVFEEEAVIKAARCAFVRKGVCFSPEDVRNCFEIASRKEGGQTLKFSYYRHVAKHFSKNVLNIGGRYVMDDEEEENGEDLIDDKQFGHSSRTANLVYARNDSESASLNRNYITENFRYISFCWHQFLGDSDCDHAGASNVGDDAGVGAGAGSGEGMVVPIAVERERNLRRALEMHLKTSDVAGREIIDANKSSAVCVTREQLVSLDSLLKRLTNLADFKNPEQRMCSAFSLFTSVDLLAIIPTGGGKSLVFILEALRGRGLGQKSVIIVPTKSLQRQIIRNFVCFGLAASGQLDDAAANCFVTTPEAFNLSSNLAIIERLLREGILKRIFVDEAHCLLIDSSYRVDISGLSNLKHLNVPLTFLTGSMSTAMSAELIAMFRRFDREFKVVRGSCNRPNLEYLVKSECDFTNLDAELNSYLAKYPGGHGRCIIYVHSHSILEEVYIKSGHLEIMTRYSSQFSDQHNEESVSNWLAGRTPVMVATSGFGVEIDCPVVRLVICFGKPYSLEEMVQLFGRGGRDGGRSSAVLMTLRDWDNQYCSGEVTTYSRNHDTCCRFVITAAIDSYPVDCGAGDFAKCDICSRDFVAISQHRSRSSVSAPPLLPPSQPPTAVRVPSTGVPTAPRTTKDIAGANGSVLASSACNPAFTQEGAERMQVKQVLKSDLMRCLHEAVEKCLFCLFIEQRIVSHSGACLKYRNRCFKCTKEGHDSNADDNSVCPKWSVDPNIRHHFTCGLSRELCGTEFSTQCQFRDILPVFYRMRVQPGSPVQKMGLKELNGLYLEFVTFMDMVLASNRS